MKNSGVKLLLVVLSFACVNFVQAQKNVKKTFPAKEKIMISTVSGNCTVKKSTTGQIEVQLNYTYSDDCFQYEFEEAADNLKITERIKGHNCSGKSEWSIAVPENTKVWYNTASGDFWISDMKKGLSANSASGDMHLRDISGEIELNTASGDIYLQGIKGELKTITASGNVKMEDIDAKTSVSVASGDVGIMNSMQDLKISTASGNVKIIGAKSRVKVSVASGDITLTNFVGACDINTASGDINASKVELTEKSSLITASGDMALELSKSLENDLSLTSASGNITLNYNGNPVKGYFEFTAREKKGRIVSPYKFDKEEVVEIDETQYDKKSFTLGSDSPKVMLKTSSGTIKLEK